MLKSVVVTAERIFQKKLEDLTKQRKTAERYTVL